MFLTGTCDRWGLGTAVMGPPIKKCPGVKAFGSFGSVDSRYRGLELRQASIFVLYCSYVKSESPATAVRCFLVALTPAS